jgi:hypothetical protein
MTVVPGTTVYVPRQAWHGLRNTGTGVLQITWTSAPPGIEQFFRELSQVGASPDAAAFQKIAQRHGIEFRPEGQPAGTGAPSSGQRRRRRHRGGRGRSLGKGHQEQPSQGQQTQPAAPSIPPPREPRLSRRGGMGTGVLAKREADGTPPVRVGGSIPTPPLQTVALSPTVQPAVGQGRRRRRSRHRRGAGQEGARGARTSLSTPTLQRQQSSPPTQRSVVGEGSAPDGHPSGRPPQSSARGPRRGERRRRSGHVKEVYMGGRWIRVVGEGPVISPGPEQSGRSRQGAREDDTPPGPLSVSL